LELRAARGSVGTIAEKMDVNGATLSFHLKELANANLVTSRQAGRFVFYTANYDTTGAKARQQPMPFSQSHDGDRLVGPRRVRNKRNNFSGTMKLFHYGRRVHWARGLDHIK
jgi:DNA-binding transcriptional ArsR family regulator